MATGLPGRIEAKTLKVLSEGGNLNFTEAGVHRNWKVRGVSGARAQLGACLWQLCWALNSKWPSFYGGEGSTGHHLFIHSASTLCPSTGPQVLG